jgi:hypothetical protein
MGSKLRSGASSPVGIRPSDRGPVRPASLFLFGQPRFGIFVNDMCRGSLLCASGVDLWRRFGFRMICGVHRLLLLLYGRQACADAARQLLIVHFIFLSTGKMPGGEACKHDSCGPQWLSTPQTICFVPGRDTAARWAHCLRSVARHLYPDHSHPVDANHRDRGDESDKDAEINRTWIHKTPSQL